MKKMRKMRLFQKDAYIGIDFLDKKTEIIKLKTEAKSDADLFSFDIGLFSGLSVFLLVRAYQLHHLCGTQHKGLKTRHFQS
jgi:hypothetical protein